MPDELMLLIVGVKLAYWANHVCVEDDCDVEELIADLVAERNEIVRRQRDY